jgi:hypothetical protein
MAGILLGGLGFGSRGGSRSGNILFKDERVGLDLVGHTLF